MGMRCEVWDLKRGCGLARAWDLEPAWAWFCIRDLRFR